MRCLFLLAFLPFACKLSAQNLPCGTDYLHKKAMQENPVYRAAQEAWEQKCLGRSQNPAARLQSAPTYTLPVVVHVIHQNGLENIPDAQILDGIQQLNEAYANTGYYDQGNGVTTPFQFCLARRKPDGSATNGIDRLASPLTNMTMETDDIPLKDLSRWDPLHYINIWLVAEVTSSASGPGVAGYAFFPGSHGTNVDGLVFEARWFGSSPANTSIAVHEMGHYLGLYHTFQGGCTNDDCTVDGDRVCDTPPDASTANVPCDISVNTCTTDALSGFATDQPDMIINYMDYSTLACFNAFTQGQSTRMESALLDTRFSLLESNACVDPCMMPFAAAFSSSAQSVPYGTTVNFTNLSINGVTWSWLLDGTEISTAQNAAYTFNSLGSFIVTLHATGADPNCDDRFSDTISVTCPVIADFSLSNLMPATGTLFTGTSTSTAATAFEWSINGVVMGAAAVQNFSLSTPGIYTVCLTASSSICNNQFCREIEVVNASPCFLPPCTEDCANGIDDDGDGLIDCYDTYDCSCTVVPDCSITEFDDKDFGARLAWMSTTNIVNVTSAPMVANLNPAVDNIPEIIVNRYDGNTSNKLLIFNGDGANASAPSQLAVPGGLTFYPGPAPCIADINNDGIPELMIVCNDKKIRVFTNYNPTNNPVMSLWMTSTSNVAQIDRHVYVADFDSDGMPELYVGADVFKFDFTVPASPQLNLAASAPAGPIGLISSFFASYNTSSVAADLLKPSDCGGDPDCNGLEIAAGYAIYSVDLTTADGDPMQIKLQKNLNTLAPGHNFTDGYTVFADIDLNGIPEVIVSGSANGKLGVYAWNKTGFWTFFPNQNDNDNSTGVVAVANVFDDKTKGFLVDYPELIATNSYSLNCFNYHAAQTTPTQPYWWVLPTTDYSGYTGVTTFDFNGDKIQELVYRDERSLRIMYGGPTPFPAGVDAQRNWDTFDAYSITADEYAIVADVDADGQAEIVYTANPNYSQSPPYSGRLVVLESDELYHDPWLSARDVWNQYNYFVTNINDDLSVPAVQQPGWLEMPTLGSGKRPMNNFLFQVPKYDENFDPFLPLSDATLKMLDVTCQGDHYELGIRICNTGAKPLKSNTPVTFYAGTDPFTSAATKIGTYTVMTVPLQVDSCFETTIALPPYSGKLYAVINDPGLLPTPFTGDTAFYVAECDYLNNTDTLTLGKAAPALELGPDMTGCETGVFIFHAGPGFKTYHWQDGSTDSTYTAWLPGKYWVEVTDVCHNTRRDTIEVLVDPATQFDLGPDQFFCGPATLHFNVNGFESYLWFPETGLSCIDCATPLAQSDSDMTYTLLAKTASGCLSMDSIHVIVHDTSLQTVQVSRCTGDSFLYNGDAIPAGSDKTYAYSTQYGCDSTILVKVNALPKSVTSAAYDLCFGESIPVFGLPVSTPGVYSAHMVNIYGCDSLHTITVNVFPPVQNTSENRKICPGDSTLVFGIYVKTTGVFDLHAPNINGCDSVHSVSVALFSPPQNTSESQQICPGDSILVFGNFIKTAGTFFKHTANINGCDSLHTVVVSVFPQPQNTSENRQICPGDSTLVFGNFIKTAGVFQQPFANTNGCDSMHTVNIFVFPQPQNTSESRQICPGDSTLVFGSFVKTSGLFSQAFPNTNGCDSVHSVNVTLFALPQNTSESHQICPGDSVLVFGNFVKTTGVISQTFSNGNGCDSLHTVTVNVFPQPQNTAENRQICPGDSTLVFGSFIKTAGIFNHTFANTNGCDSIHSISVALFPQPQNTSENRQICPGDSTLVFGSFVKTGGVYSKTFPNQNGCDSIHSIGVTLFPQPQNTSEEKSICDGDSIPIFGQWIGQAGIYEKHFPNLNGCDSIHFITLFVKPLPTPTLIITPPGCGETAGSLTIQGQNPGDLFGFDGISFTQMNYYHLLFPNSYVLLVHGANGCATTAPFTMPQPPPSNFSSDSLQVCAGDSALVFGQWIKQQGVFAQTFVNQFDCDSVVMHTVQILPQATLTKEVKQPSCLLPAGVLKVQTTSPGATFSLDETHFTSSGEFTGLEPGDYRVYVQSAEGCIHSESFTVDEIVYPALQLPGDTLINLGESVQIIPTVYPFNTYTYDWMPSTYLDCAKCPKPVSTPFENMEYKLVVTDPAGCTATDKIRIRVNEPDIYVPNVFTPNDDNTNDVFTIYASQTGVRRVVKLQIFDRWGTLLFERNDFQANDESLGWHGDFRGEPMGPAVFVWWAEVEFVNGKKILLKGDVTLVR